MNITKRAGLTAAFALICSLFIHAARADICWETETTMTNVRHNSNGSSIQKYYLTTTAFRLELDDKKVFILNHNSMRLYSLDPKKQKFSVLDLNSLPGFPARLLAALVGLRVTPDRRAEDNFRLQVPQVVRALCYFKWGVLVFGRG